MRKREYRRQKDSATALERARLEQRRSNRYSTCEFDSLASMLHCLEDTAWGSPYEWVVLSSTTKSVKSYNESPRVCSVLPHVHPIVVPEIQRLVAFARLRWPEQCGEDNYNTFNSFSLVSPCSRTGLRVSGACVWPVRN